MNHFKSLVFLLISLLLLQGCTVMNYHLGKEIDESYPREKVPVEDYKQLEIGNLVEIRLKDKTRIRGKITNLKPQQHLLIRDIGLNGKKRFDVETIKFEEISTIYSLNYAREFRFILGFLGFFGDVFLVLLIWLSTQPPMLIMS